MNDFHFLTVTHGVIAAQQLDGLPVILVTDSTQLVSTGTPTLDQENFRAE